jgi:dolichol-phosphate mannosyltransferase
MIEISIISPIYKAGNIVDKLVEEIIKSVSEITSNYEIILVEDGSPDNSWEKIEENCKKNGKVKGVKLSRNFGQHFAITAGLTESKGENVIVMDCDLQDNPKYIIDLVNKAKLGFDIVYTSKLERQHSVFKNITSIVFFKIFNYLTDNQTGISSIGAYSLLTRKVVDAFCRINDTHRHYLMILRTLGFVSTQIPIIHDKRFEGKSSYNFSKLINHALDGITSQSDKLLRISISVGFLFCVISIATAIYTVAKYLIIGALPGYTSLTSLISLSTGLILLSIGVVGMYIGKIFEQVKNRPLYFIDRKINI